MAAVTQRTGLRPGFRVNRNIYHIKQTGATMEICRVVLPWTLVISVNTLSALQSGNGGVGPLAGPLDSLDTHLGLVPGHLSRSLVLGDT